MHRDRKWNRGYHGLRGGGDEEPGLVGTDVLEAVEDILEVDSGDGCPKL